MNKCAISNVKDDLFVKKTSCKKRVETAKEEGMTDTYIEMYQDMATLYGKCLEIVETDDEELEVTQSDIDAFKAYIEDCMDDVAFGNTDWNHSYALALKCMEAHLKK